MTTKDPVAAELLNLALRIFSYGFYYKDLRSKNLDGVNWGGLIQQEDALILRIRISQLSKIIGSLIEHGQGPASPAAVFCASGASPIFGTVGELTTKLKGLQEQDLALFIHEAVERIQS